MIFLENDALRSFQSRYLSADGNAPARQPYCNLKNYSYFPSISQRIHRVLFIGTTYGRKIINSVHNLHAKVSASFLPHPRITSGSPSDRVKCIFN